MANQHRIAAERYAVVDFFAGLAVIVLLLIGGSTQSDLSRKLVPDGRHSNILCSFLRPALRLVDDGSLYVAFDHLRVIRMLQFQYPGGDLFGSISFFQ